LGYAPSLHGRFDTIVTTSHPLEDGPPFFWGHDDSVPRGHWELTTMPARSRLASHAHV
jgi:hypothetical protein